MVSFDHAPLTGTGSAVSHSFGCCNNSSIPQEQNLGTVLQDIDLWRNSTPVHVNILHSAQHVLLERWVISYTPATVLASSPISSTDDSPRGAKSPYAGYLSPRTKHLQTTSARSPSGSTSASSSAAPKDTTDLVLLLQSLYTQIRSLPLQNCLTSFEDKIKLTKADLAYSVTSAHEDITQSHQDRTPHIQPQNDVENAAIKNPSETVYNAFVSSLKSTLPLEFVQAASLKVINFEASHVQWGCVRVTGMYDESVGGRIAPENFQDSIIVQKKRHHRSKGSSLSHSSDAAAAAKATRRQQKDTGSWTSLSQPVKADTSTECAEGSASALPPKSSSCKAAEQISGPKSETTSVQPSHSTFSQQANQADLSASSSGDQLHARLQSLKKSNERIFFSLSPSIAQPTPTAPEGTKDQRYISVLQESLLPKHGTNTQNNVPNEERIQEYKFPSIPSPPLSIPQPRKSIASDIPSHSVSLPVSDLERMPTKVGYAPPHHQQHPTALQHSPPFVQQQSHHVHSPFSTSPLAHVITRRRSSRLSIVMTCNDDSPDPTRQQSPLAETATTDEHGHNQLLDDDSEDASSYGASSQFSRRGSLQDQKRLSLSEAQQSRPPLAPSPTRPTFLRRSSLNPTSFSHGDLFGSLVGSYEESILSGRMSTLPSKPLIFTAQIGVLANQDYKDCPPKLRCPKHVQLEFPAVFYDYDSSSSHHGHHHNSHHSIAHSLSHQQYLHHYYSTQSFQSKSVHTFGHHASTSPSHHQPLGSFASSPALSSYFSSSANMTSSYGSGPSSVSHNFAYTSPATHDDPILPYVGNLDLDSGFRGSRRFARMPGGMRIPLRGQVQVMIKNPNKTVVKVFLVPYDFTDMPPGTKTFLRQKYYSTGPGVGPVTSNQNSNGTLRYAIHLQFCCPAPGYVYLYRSIRVVFANRVPDGKESLRVVLEGLGLGSRTIENLGTTNKVLSTLDTVPSDPTQTGSKKLEERYVKMRKGEVSFCASKRKMEQNGSINLFMDSDPLMSMAGGLGLGLDKDYVNASRPHDFYEPSLAYQHRQQLNFDGQPYNDYRRENMNLQDMVIDRDIGRGASSPFHKTPIPRRAGTSEPLSPTTDRVVAGLNDDEGADDYRRIQSSVLIGHTPAIKSPGVTPKAGSSSSSSGVSPSLSTPYDSKESSFYFKSGPMGIL
ncbi:hypothetical protein BGZ54_008412 [Gamsiella multidivaricata]|nr:hypothetical protein BGZ54_008412 [Gamsiella multidivaricata]